MTVTAQVPSSITVTMIPVTGVCEVLHAVVGFPVVVTSTQDTEVVQTGVARP